MWKRVLGTKKEENHSRAKKEATSAASKGITHSKIVRAGWGDEGSGADEDTGMDDWGILRKGKRQAFCPWQQKEEKSWKQQGPTHLKSTNIIDLILTQQGFEKFFCPS